MRDKIFSEKALFIIIIVYISSIFLSPRLVCNFIRLEDILSPIFLILGLPLLFKYLKKYPIVAGYFTFVLCVTLIGIWRECTSSLGILIYLKELQYFFLALFLFEYRSRGYLVDYFRRPFKIIFSVIAVFSIFNIVQGNLHSYGVSAINEISPALSAWIFTGVAILLYLFGRKHKIGKLDMFLFGLIFIFIFFVGSRTGLIILSLFYLYLAYQFLKKRLLYIISLLLLVYIGLVVFAPSENMIREKSVFQVFDRYVTLADIDAAFEPRRDAWKKRTIEDYSFCEKLIGRGRGFSNMEWEEEKKGEWRGFAMVVDSQYIRNVQEIGFVGSAIFFIMLGSFFWHIPKEDWLLYTTILTIYLLSFLTMESFQISKPGALFWIIVALLVNVKSIRK
jgi:hypothetical protein